MSHKRVSAGAATRFGRRGRIIAVLTGLVCALAMAPGAAQARFDLGLEDGNFFISTETAKIATDALATLHGTTVRLPINWSSIAPSGAKMPAGFDAANPADPLYRWGTLDYYMRIAAAERVRLVLNFVSAPAWAEGPKRPHDKNIGVGAWAPNPAAFKAFMRAAALRYSGRYPDPLFRVYGRLTLPRVKYWEIWNEENLPYALAAPNLVGEYRALLNGAYTSLKTVKSDNVVITGGLAPVSFIPPLSVSPLKFAAQLTCLRRVGTQFRRTRSCRQPAHFDVFGFHPYSVSATPTKHAYHYDDVLVGDMGKLSVLLNTAHALRTVIPRSRHAIWVTEWGWFTRPPDKLVGDAEPVAARYIAYSMYEMWRSGVQTLVWLGIFDAKGNLGSGITGGGLYTSVDHPKLILRALVFPFIAATERRGGYAWGRAPVSSRTRVIVERRTGRRWRRVGGGLTNVDGIFLVRFRARGNAVYRARVLSGPTSLAYNSRPIPPRRTHHFYPG